MHSSKSQKQKTNTKNQLVIKEHYKKNDLNID
ncbi:hypothetical protein PSECIP111951_02882 [Pseudoalteromonas holothuriae]|uniref:Uncharacterized protein n=1 Tax=Pseudoalteromonas holothuriae TaxID=2963714 RepID=A0A9W4VWL9_9GAMM|nr:hypothetical protein PSECIP111854_02546 [Pseudoalteromonas sp. CIP111854]CAH9063333.1 hypothetical protein PSECIP111951_02882 [Pseudoalteromonas sp. CIP111951]